MMTKRGTFIINGAERVVVSQLVRSPGVYYSLSPDTSGRPMPAATVIPHRGAWLELEMDNNGVISTRIDRTRKIPVTVLLRALGYESDEKILKLYDGDAAIEATLTKDPVKERKGPKRSEEHTSELQSQSNLVCRLLLEKKKNNQR